MLREQREIERMRGTSSNHAPTLPLLEGFGRIFRLGHSPGKVTGAYANHRVHAPEVNRAIPRVDALDASVILWIRNGRDIGLVFLGYERISRYDQNCE